MTVDSYVVYFERMKDEVVHGRTFKNSAARSFTSTWRTILAANLVSFIAAAVLFVLSVGSVRGFALYLGVTTICDVIVLWFFTRPAVILMAGTGRLDRHDQFGTRSDRRHEHGRRPTHRRARAHVRPDRHDPLAPPDPRPDGDRLLGPAPRVDGHLAGAAGDQRGCRCGSAAWCSASTSRAASPGTCRPASSPIDDARGVLDDDGIESRHGQDPGAQLRQRRHHQGPGRGPARGACGCELQEAFAEAAGVDPADVSVASVSATWGEEITRKAVIALVVFLVLIAVYISFRFEWRMALTAPAGDAPRRRHQRRDLLGVRLRGHAGDGDRLPHGARLLAVRQHRRVRPHPGQRAARRRRRADGRRPRSTSR